MELRTLQFEYLRLSKEDGDVAEGISAESVSIASQRACIGQFLRTHPELSGEFEEIVDDGYSGTHFERPGVKRLLRLCELGRVKTVIVRDLSRFARNYLEAGHYLEHVFPACGVRFISINDGYDSAAYTGETAGLHVAVKNLLNQLYSRDISRKIKSSVDLKKNSGEYVYGAVPYGYRKGDKKNTIVVDPPAALVVRRIFQMACDGSTVTEIARTLNREGVTTPSVYLASVRGKYKTRSFWTYDSVRNILKNRIYTGDTVPFKSHVVRVGSDRVKMLPEDQQTVIPETHEGIITREAFYQAREVIKSNTKSPPQGRSSILNGYLVCGCCGNRMSKGKAKNKSFLCASARYNPESRCKEVRADEDTMKGVILRAIQQQCMMVDAHLKIVSANMKSAQNETAAVNRDMRIQRLTLERVRNEKVALYEAYVSGTISKDDYLKEKNLLNEAEQSAGVSLSLLEERKKQLDEASSERERQSGEAFLSRYLHISELNDALMSEMIEKILVFPGNSIRICWNFGDISGAVQTGTSVLTSEQ